MLSITLLGCKSKNSSYVSNFEKSKIDPCISLRDYEILNDTEEKAAWLRLNGDKVCQVILYDAIEKDHKIDAVVTTSTTTRPFKITWDDMSRFVGNGMYNAYIGFEIDANNNITNLKLIPKFTINEPCYSIPLIRYLAFKYNLRGNENLEFLNIITPFREKIAIKVNSVYYDYSDEPKIINEKPKSKPL